MDKIDFRLKKLLLEEFFGDFASGRRGFGGFELEEIRDFREGDPPSAINARLSFRRGRPTVKVTNPDKGVTAHFVCEFSRSMSIKRIVAQMIIEILTEHLSDINAHFACTITTSEVEHEITSGCGVKHTDNTLRMLQEYQPRKSGTSYASIASVLSRIPLPPRLVFIVTDLLVPQREIDRLRNGARIHDVILCIIRDPSEMVRRRVFFGTAHFADVEDGGYAVGSIVGPPDVRNVLVKVDADWGIFSTKDPRETVLETLVALFEGRKKRKED